MPSTRRLGIGAVLEKAHAMHNVQVSIAGKAIVKEIYVKGRIVNIVVK